MLKPDSAAFVNSDGDFDNGIIAHEYGHGISTVCQVVRTILDGLIMQIKWAKAG
jgi:hypothetical protein